MLEKLELRGDGKVSVAIGARLPAGSVLSAYSSAEMIALALANYAVGDGQLSLAEADADSLAYTTLFDAVFFNECDHAYGLGAGGLAALYATGTRGASRAISMYARPTRTHVQMVRLELEV